LGIRTTWLLAVRFTVVRELHWLLNWVDWRFFETSAKTGENVEEAFSSLVKEIYRPSGIEQKTEDSLDEGIRKGKRSALIELAKKVFR